MSTSERRVADRAHRELLDAGYPLVEREPRWAADRGIRPDLIAWATQPDGSFGPFVCVEAKARADRISVQSAVAALGAYSSALGTSVNLICTPDGWYEVNPGFTDATAVGPVPPAPGGVAHITDQDVLEQLLAAQVWKAADAMRGSRPDNGWEALRLAIPSGSGSHVPGPVPGTTASGGMYAQAWLNVALRWGSRARGMESLTGDALRRAMADLAGPYPDDSVVFDPFAGHGGSLLAAGESAAEQGARVSLVGREINENTTVVANQILRLAGLSGEVLAQDAFHSPSGEFATVVSDPPMGMRLRNSYETPVGVTSDGDVATVALAATALLPGGRAVLLTSRGWTFKGGLSVQLRNWLATHRRVSALIGLPSGILAPLTNIPALLVVIDNTTPGETLVADLGDDWASHLTTGSPLMEAVPPRSSRQL